MGVHQLHLVLETPGNADDHVADHGFDGTETSYVFTSAVPDGEDDLGVFGGLDLNGRRAEGDGVGFGQRDAVAVISRNPTSNRQAKWPIRKTSCPAAIRPTPSFHSLVQP
jgi:hypothetical protein